MKRKRVVASYTTLPGRYETLRESILSLKVQTWKLDEIYVTIPFLLSRTGVSYPPVPETLSELCTIIRTNTDYGPCTKMYGALISEREDNTVIISCDDDTIFQPNHVESLMKCHEIAPNSAICGTGALIGRGLFFISIVSTVSPFQRWSRFTGFHVGEEGRKVDLIFGVASVLYSRSMFPSSELLEGELLVHALSDDSIFHNDDVLISGYLSSKGVERRVFSNIPTVQHNGGPDALSSNLPRMIFRLQKSIQKVRELGFFPSMEEVPLQETPLGRVVFWLVVLSSFFLLSLVLFWGFVDYTNP